MSTVAIKPDHDAHVVLATDLFRKAGFSLAAMAYKRSPEALLALKRYNGLKPDAVVPFAWGYFPNAWCRDNDLASKHEVQP